MGDFQRSLREWLAAEITEVGGRVVPDQTPPGMPIPFIKYNRVTTEREYAHDGSTRLAAPTMQLSVYHSSKQEARDIARKIQNKLEGYRGLMGDVVVQGVFLDDETHDFDSDTEYYFIESDYIVQYYE